MKLFTKGESLGFRNNFMRPDYSRFLRPDGKRWRRPDSARFHCPLSGLCSIIQERKYRSDQPRVPAGSPDGGQWTSGVLDEAWGIRQNELDQDRVRTRLAQVGSSIVDQYGRPYYEVGGHHEMPRSVYSKWDLDPETRKVFNQSTTGSLPGRTQVGPGEGLLRGHYWDGPEGHHARYNRAVSELSEQFMKEKKITTRDMTPDHAKELLARIRLSDVPEIRDYNRMIRLLRRVFRLRFGRE